MQDKSNNQALFHFLLCELIVECSENVHRGGKEESVETRLRQVGAEMGFKMFTHLSLKRGVTERPQTIADLLKTVKTRVFKHLFNYELSGEINTYRNEQLRTIVYGLIDEYAIYLTWMPEPSQIVASSVVAGVIEGVCCASDLKCSVTAVRAESEREDKVVMEFLIEVENDEHNRWEAKKN